MTRLFLKGNLKRDKRVTDPDLCDQVQMACIKSTRTKKLKLFFSLTDLLRRDDKVWECIVKFYFPFSLNRIFYSYRKLAEEIIYARYHRLAATTHKVTITNFEKELAKAKLYWEDRQCYTKRGSEPKEEKKIWMIIKMKNACSIVSLSTASTSYLLDWKNRLLLVILSSILRNLVDK